MLDPGGAIVGSLDLPQSIEALEVSGGMLRASGRRSTFAVDVSDPTRPVLASTTLRAPAPAPLVAAPFASAASAIRTPCPTRA